MARSPIFDAIVQAVMTETDDALAALAPDDMASLLTLKCTPKERKQLRWGALYRLMTEGMTRGQIQKERMKPRVIVAILKSEFGDGYHDNKDIPALSEVIGGNAGPKVTNNVDALHQHMPPKYKAMMLKHLGALLPPKN